MTIVEFIGYAGWLVIATLFIAALFLKESKLTTFAAVAAFCWAIIQLTFVIGVVWHMVYISENFTLTSKVK